MLTSERSNSQQILYKADRFSVFMLYFITTKDGRKYHLTTNAGMRGSEKLGSFMSMNDLTEKRSR